MAFTHVPTLVIIY